MDRQIVYPSAIPQDLDLLSTNKNAMVALGYLIEAILGNSTLADLYDPLTMPAALARAHNALDRAVERCYRPEPFASDRQRVEHLFALYEKLTAPLLPATVSSRRKKPR